MSGLLSMTGFPTVAAPADEQVAPSSLARFGEALQPGVMGPRLATLTGAATTACHVLDAKFEPGIRAIVLYELAGSMLRGDLLPTSEPAASDSHTSVVPPGLCLHLFPADPQLPALPRVVDPAHLGPALSRELGLHGGARTGPRTARCRITVLRYRPGKRATVLVAYAGGGRYIAKAYHDPAKGAAVAQESVALVAACTATSALRLAPTLAHLSDLAVVVQGPVAGTPLDVLLGGPHGPARAAHAAVRRTARALAEFHEATAVGIARQRSVDGELRRFGERAARIGTVAPQLGAFLAELGDRLVATQACLPASRLGHVHGDCKPSQFLFTDQYVCLMDLDHVGLSDQAGDVGTFLASLRHLAVRRTLKGARGDAVGELGELSRLFLEAYEETRGADSQRPRARWHEAVALERKALRAFARAPASPLAGALAAQAHRCLDELVEET
ncbi:MAG: hypothetical protein ACRDPK_06240 [Carbonactinosporaceae bacterium]